MYPEVKVLRLPRFRNLKSVIMYVPGPLWSDLIYEIAAWSARDKKLPEEIADIACHDGRASPSSPSMPSTSPATRADWWEDWKKTKIRFTYPVGKGDVDWRKLESAVLGEGPDGGYDCTGYGNHGGEEGPSRDGNDDVDETMMRINNVERDGADGGCCPRFVAGSLWIEARGGSAVLGDVRGELRRLDQLGLLQVGCR